MMHKNIRRILIVDDEVEFVNSVNRHLRRKGFLLDAAYDRTVALKKIKASGYEGRQYDLLITDMAMSNMGGMKLLWHIKKHYPSISVLLVSDFNDLKRVRENIRKEMDDFIQKPITPHGMAKLIEHVDIKRYRHYQKQYLTNKRALA